MGRLGGCDPLRAASSHPFQDICTFGRTFPTLLCEVSSLRGGRSQHSILHVGILAVLYGELARDFLEQNLPVVGTVLFALFVTAMVSYAIMWLRARRRSPRREIA